MSSYFLKSGNTWRVTSKEALDLHHKLPASNYVVKFDPMTGFYFEDIEPFSLPNKLYGSTTVDATRILSTFKNRESSTGVLLAGEQGSGKTLLAKMISIDAVKDSIPTIVINTPHCGDAFNTFIQDIEQPCIVMFDEFEKVYNDEQQQQVLTLFDGVFNSRKLFLLTCNNKWRINQHMRNRPGRIFYLMDFEGLTVEFVREYCEDCLDNKSYIDQVCKVASMFKQFNFDMLQALVEEMNRYNESPTQSLRMLNTKPEFSDHQSFSVTLKINGVKIGPDKLENSAWSGNPLSDNPTVGFFYNKTGIDDEENVYNTACFLPTDIVKMDSMNGSFVYLNSRKESLTLKKIETRNIDYRLLL